MIHVGVVLQVYTIMYMDVVYKCINVSGCGLTGVADEFAYVLQHCTWWGLMLVYIDIDIDTQVVYI